MNICPGIQIIDLSLYLPSFRCLIIADTHIGLEEAMNKQGLLVPRFQFPLLLKRMKVILSHLRMTKEKKLAKIILNGDVKHEFGRISDTEWRNTLKFIDFLSGYCDEIVLIKGNHDTILGPIAAKRNVIVKEFERLGDILVIHGSEIPKKLEGVHTIIIGHEHPAISLSDHVRTETYKCFLKGTYKGKTLIVQPSFNFVSEGTNILREEILSPFLKQSLKTFDVYIVEDYVYHFGKLQHLLKK